MKVYVASVGLQKIGDHWESSLLDLAVEASLKAIGDEKKVKPQQIIVGNMLSSAGARQEHLGAFLASGVGLSGTPAYKVEAASASGSAAFNVAYSMLKGGAIDSALVVGVEKMRDLEPDDASLALAMAESAEYTQFVGASFTALGGLLARHYMERENVSRDELSALPVLSHANAVTAQHAQFRRAITPEVVAKSAIVSDPLRLFDCAPVGDGAAAALLVNERLAGQTKRRLVEVLGGSVSTSDFSIYERKDPLRFEATERAFKQATQEASLPLGKVDLVETHDAFSVVAALSLEAMGFSRKGEGARDAKAGKFAKDGELPINTFGGLKARGHPVGATGLYQIGEVYLQLTENAGKNQVEGARYAVTQNVGGVDTTAAVHVFGRSS